MGFERILLEHSSTTSVSLKVDSLGLLLNKQPDLLQWENNTDVKNTMKFDAVPPSLEQNIPESCTGADLGNGKVCKMLDWNLDLATMGPQYKTKEKVWS